MRPSLAWSRNGSHVISISYLDLVPNFSLRCNIKVLTWSSSPEGHSVIVKGLVRWQVLYPLTPPTSLSRFRSSPSSFSFTSSLAPSHALTSRLDPAQAVATAPAFILPATSFARRALVVTLTSRASSVSSCRAPLLLISPPHPPFLNVEVGTHIEEMYM